MNIQKVKITAIRSNPSNPRIIKDEKFKKLVQSIKDLPQMLEIRPIVVNNEMMVLGGNMRLKACIEAGLKEVFIICADELTEAEQKEFTIKDNLGFGEWDWAMLANEWDVDKLSDWGMDIPKGFGEQLEAEEDDYEILDEIQTDIVLGDLFEIGEHRLLCGDSTMVDEVERLMNGKKADMVFTSPPYNTNNFNLTQKANSGKKYAKNIYNSTTMDKKTSLEYLQFNQDIFGNILLIASNYCNVLYNISYNQNSSQEYIQIINNAINSGYKLQETIIWVKSSAIPQQIRLTRKTEFIFLLSNYEDDVPKSNQKKNDTTYNVWEVSNTGAQQATHNACFPVGLAEKGISLYCTEGGFVFEPFCGAGSTMVAAHQLKRKCYGIELDPKYCQVIIDRMLKLDPSLKIKRNGEFYETSGKETK
jgi:DNA modification methylase